MFYCVNFHIPGIIKLNAESPEEAEQLVEAMDAADLAPALESTVVDKVTKPPESIQSPSGESPEARTKTSGESPPQYSSRVK